MTDPISTVAVAPWWVPYSVPIIVSLLGSGALLTEGLRKWRSGYGKAEARKVNAEAALAEASARQVSTNRTVDYERMLNERTFKNMDLLENSVKHLTELVEAQSIQLTSQSAKIDHMDREIKALHETLEHRTNELRNLKLHFPPVCKSCTDFNGDRCTIMGLHCKFTPTQDELPLNDTNN